MGFLHRSRSTAAAQRAERRKDAQTAGDHEDPPRSKDGQGAIPRGRRAPSPDRQRSFSRPRTANAAVERSADLEIFNQTIEIKAGNDIFRFPTPSPRLAPRSATFPPQQPSPLSVGSSPKIGVAIGSPSQAKPSWTKSKEAEQLQYRAPAQPPPAQPPPAQPPPAQPPPAKAPPAVPDRLVSEVPKPDLVRKKSGWKNFGSLFGRKNAKVQAVEPFYKVKQPHEHPDVPASRLPPPRTLTEALAPLRSPAPTSSPLSVTHHPRRTPSMTRGQARLEARAEADREAFSKQGKLTKARSPSMIQRSGFSPMFDSFRRVSEDFFKGEGDARKDSPLSMDGTPENLGAIPRTPRLDLSIPDSTFERYSVMFEQVLDQRDQQRRPSLLERRQSKLQRNRSTQRLDTVIDEGTHLETVSSAVSSASEITVTPPYVKKALSITVNGVNRPRPIQRSRTAPPAAISPRSPNLAAAARSPGARTITEGSLPPTPMTFATISESESIAVINNDLRQAQRKTDRTEPTWDMVTSYDRSSPYLRVKSPEDLERQILQVSVARQVSVNKARKQVEKAVASKQPLKPKVVDLGNRKSTVVIIESGDD